MTEEEWLACEDPQEMVRYLRHNASARQLRLWACAFARNEYGDSQELMEAVRIAEDWADGKRPQDLGVYAKYYVCLPHAWQAADEGTAEYVAIRAESSAKRRAVRFLLATLRDIFGNPFRPVAFDPAWRTDTAVALAHTMYDSREFGAMPILTDALQDAGCDRADILNHCRDTAAPHVRGCWVVDLVLGKE